MATEKREVRLREGVAERIPVQVFILTETGGKKIPALCAVNTHLSETGRSGESGYGVLLSVAECDGWRGVLFI